MMKRSAIVLLAFAIAAGASSLTAQTVTSGLRGPTHDAGALMMATMADGEMMSTAPMDMARNDPDLHDE